MHQIKALSQIHQFFITLDMKEGAHADFPASVLALKERLGSSCKAAFVGQNVTLPASQQQVSDALRGMGLSVEDQFRCPKSGYSIDMRVHDMRVNAQSSTAAEAGWAVEFDGPSHFLACRLPVGGTLMKRWHLELLGYTVVSLPFWEWDQLTGRQERTEYLRGKLHCQRDKKKREKREAEESDTETKRTFSNGRESIGVGGGVASSTGDDADKAARPAATAATTVAACIKERKFVPAAIEADKVCRTATSDAAHSANISAAQALIKHDRGTSARNDLSTKPITVSDLRFTKKTKPPQPLPDEGQGFVASMEYQGVRDGMVYRQGPGGLGYYPLVTPTPKGVGWGVGAGRQPLPQHTSANVSVGQDTSGKPRPASTLSDPQVQALA